MNKDIHFTPAAANKIGQIIGADKESEHFRIKIVGGGCMGFQHVFGLDSNQTDQDFHWKIDTTDGCFTCVVDHRSYAMLRHATIDYHNDADGERFEVNSKQLQTCSCKKSFNPKTEGV